MPNVRIAGILCGRKIKIKTITQAQIRSRLRAGLFHQDIVTDGYLDRPAEYDASSLKCAAVLMPLTYYRDEWHLLFTRRTDQLNDHSGQVAFPGGHCDLEDASPEDTALREAFEEIGLMRDDVTLLGRACDVVTVTNYKITPVVGVFDFPYGFRVSMAEVARVFTMPLAWLADSKHYWQFKHPKAQYPTIAYHPFNGELLWGATARITVNFLRTILG